MEVTLHATRSSSARPGVSVLILVVANHRPGPVSSLQVTVAVSSCSSSSSPSSSSSSSSSSSWAHRLLPLSVSTLAARTAFSPPATATAALLLANQGSVSGSGDGQPTNESPERCSLSYCLSYSVDGETVSDRGHDVLLPQL